MSEERWRDIADALAVAMEHSELGVCSLTDREHAALGRYQAERRRERAWVRTWSGLTSGLGAFVHRHRESA
jgi:hypothetical protein